MTLSVDIKKSQTGINYERKLHPGFRFDEGFELKTPICLVSTQRDIKLKNCTVVRENALSIITF